MDRPPVQKHNQVLLESHRNLGYLAFAPVTPVSPAPPPSLRGWDTEMDDNAVIVEDDDNTKDVPAIAAKDAVATAHPSGQSEHGVVDTPEHATDHTAASDVSSTAVPRLGEIDRLGQEDANNHQRIPILLSLLLLAAVTPAFLWRSRAQPLLVVWRLSFLICLASSISTYFLTKTMGARVFLCSSLGVLLAFLAHTAWSPSIGALVVLCTTHVAACLEGYALAEHRQREGAEGSAALVPDMPKEEEDRLRAICILPAIFASMLVLTLLAGVAWLVWHSEPVEELVGFLSITLSAISLFGICYTAMMQLRGRLISPLGYIFVGIYVVIVDFSCLVIYENGGGGAAIVIIGGVGSLGVTGLFGYCLAVLATFKQIKR